MNQLGLGLAALLIACGLFGCQQKTNTEGPDPSFKGDPTLPTRTAARDQALKDHHDKCVDLFVKTQGAGRGRMLVFEHVNPTYPKSLELPPDSPELDDAGKPLPARPVPWVVEKVELIGLLMGDKPRGYPGKDPKTVRKLDGFEEAGLVRLKTGSPLHVEETPGQLRVLGAVRMQPACAGCHQKPEGEILGAFSYVMKLPAR